MRNSAALITILSLSISTAFAADSDKPELTIRPESLEQMAADTGFDARALTIGAGPEKVKIAILDNGFSGFENALGKTIPASTLKRSGPVAVLPEVEEFHGLKMAEILSHMLDSAGVKYELHLFSAFGYSNLKAATDTLITEKFDLALYAQVWEYGGNPDGTGFIGALIPKVTAAGVKWINASGNFAKNMYLGKVERVADDWAYLPGTNHSVQFRCQKNSEKACRVRAVLSWNGFSDDTSVGTDKDLDMVLFDDTMRVVQTAGLVQKKTIAPGEAGASLYPREIIEATVKPGLYLLRVKIRSGAFAKSDFLRITTAGDFVEQLEKTTGETLLAPADLPQVITVGASDSDMSSSSRSLAKPELRVVSTVVTEDDQTFKGSSNSSTAVAARAALELSHDRSLSRDQLLSRIRGSAIDRTNPVVITAPVDGDRCYALAVLRVTSPEIRRMLAGGNSWVVETSNGIRVFVDEAPTARANRLGSNRTSGYRILDDGKSVAFDVMDTNGRVATAYFQQAPAGAKYCF